MENKKFQNLLFESQEQFETQLNQGVGKKLLDVNKLNEDENTFNFKISLVGISKLIMNKIDYNDVFEIEYEIMFEDDDTGYYLKIDNYNSNKNKIYKYDGWKVNFSNAKKYPESKFILKNIKSIIEEGKKEFLNEINKIKF